MIELTMYNAIKHYGDNLVLDNASFRFFEGGRVGLVGANGSGKSTILKLLAGIEPLDVDYRKICEGKSRITITKGAAVAYLEQLPSYPGYMKVIDVLGLAFRELYLLEEQFRVLEQDMAHLQGEPLDTVLRQYGMLQQDYALKGGYDRAERLSRVCTGLKFDDIFLHKDYNVLSGGEKTSVNLGRILLENPDILLLDEPTNHLDMDATEWLEEYLKAYRGIVVIVSHDRYFLDNTATSIVEVENHRCETYEGNYSAYSKKKEEDMLLQFESYRDQTKKVEAMEKAIKDLRDWAMRADNKKFFRRAASLQKRLDKMDRVDRPVFEKRHMKVDIRNSRRSGNEVLVVDGLSKSFNGKSVLNCAELYIRIGERIALIGPNGSGKTTFVRMLLGEAKADKGRITIGANVKTAYLPQSITFNNEENSVIECFREDRLILEGKAREYLARFMFFGKEPYKKVCQLSGGERVRLKLAMLLYDEINFLVLDEPTNHLDIDSMEVLEEALDEFRGTVLLISHDRYFINNVCSRVVAIEGKALASYSGNYDSYREKKDAKSHPAEPAPTPPVKRKVPVRADNGDETRAARDLSKIENDIKLLEDEIAETTKAMSDPDISHTELNELFCKKEGLNARLEEMIGTWMGLGGGA